MKTVDKVRVEEIVASLEKDSDLYYKIKNKEEAYLFSSTLNSNNYFNFMQEFVGLFENGKDCLSLYRGYDYEDYALVDENEALEIIKVKYEPAKTIKNPTYDDLKPLFNNTDPKDVEHVDLYDTVEKPKHYNVFEKETICTIKDLLDNNDNYNGFESYCIGNSLKYIFRAGLKGDYYEDLEKARYYINKILEGDES